MVRLDHVIQSQTVAVGNSLIESRLSSAYQLLYRGAATLHTASKISLLGAVQLVVFVMYATGAEDQLLINKANADEDHTKSDEGQSPQKT
jgi:hypothetical protein